MVFLDAGSDLGNIWEFQVKCSKRASFFGLNPHFGL
jgi:hypothetical protein